MKIIDALEILGIFTFLVCIMWWAIAPISVETKCKNIVHEEIVKMVKPEYLLDKSMTLSNDVTIEMAPGSK